MGATLSFRRNSAQPHGLSSNESARGRSPRAVFVLGPSSSGKTTLCNAFAADVKIDSSRYIREVARSVMKIHGFTRADTDTYEMQYEIMMAQLRAEEEVVQKGTPTAEGGVKILFVSDRSAIDPIVYATTSTAPGASDTRRKLLHNPNFQEILPFYRSSLFIVLPPVIAWIRDDGVRSLEDPWRYNEKLHQTLRELEVPFVQLEEHIKDIGERVQYVKQLISW